MKLVGNCIDGHVFWNCVLVIAGSGLDAKDANGKTKAANKLRGGGFLWHFYAKVLLALYAAFYKIVFLWLSMYSAFLLILAVTFSCETQILINIVKLISD